MVTDAFGSLLQDLGKLLNVTLQPDSNNSCIVKFPAGPTLQLEIDKAGTSLMLVTNLGVIPAGRYRENVFKEALKSNGLPPPRKGDFSFSKKTDSLLMMELLPLADLNADKIMAVLTPFMEKAKLWKEAIERGDVPSSLPGAYAKSGGGIFGLK